MRRALVLVGNIALALLIGLLLLFGWERAYYYVGSQFVFPVLTAHYKAVGYRDVEPIRDTLVFNAVFAIVVGLTISFITAFALRLRGYVLVPILIGVTWLVAQDFPARGRPGIIWMLLGWGTYFFVVAMFAGGYLGELARKKYLAARLSMDERSFGPPV
jgi:hypothetical protein